MSRGASRQPVQRTGPGQQAEGAGATAGKSKSQATAVQEAKREARMQRQAQERAAMERRRRIASIRKIGILAVIALLAVGGGLALYLNEANKPGESVSQQPSPHITSASDPHSYSTDPPTSGPHLRQTAPWGVSSTPVVKEEQVHNLEDGGVVINYRPDLDKPTVDRLAELARSYDTQVLMSPYPGLAQPIVLTAWGRIDRLSSLDEARIKRFVKAYRGVDHHKDSGS